MPTKRTVTPSPLKYEVEHRMTLQAASRALEDTDKLKRRLTEVSNAASEGDDLMLVASGGEEVKVKACLAQCASEYFRTALESGCKEAVDKRFEIKDVSIAALRFIASGIYAGEACADIVALPTPLDACVVEQIIDLAARILMPWLARAAIRRTVESTDLSLLVRLLLAAEGHVQQMLEGSDADSLPSLWGELSTAAVPCVARMIEGAVKGEAFCGLSLVLVQRILVLIDGLAWCDWHELDVVAAEFGDFRSSTTNKGFYLKVGNEAEGGVGAYVFTQAVAEAPVVIGEHALMGFEYEIEAWSRTGEWDPRGGSIISDIVHIGTGWGSPEYLSSGECKDYVHGGSYKFRFRARRSKLQVQCHALLACIRARLAAEAGAGPQLIAAALELLHDSNEGLNDLRAMLLEYLAAAFSHCIGGEVLGQLSYRDMEAIITHPKLFLCSKGELGVLQGVLEWAQSPKRLIFSVGDEERVLLDDSGRKQGCAADSAEGSVVEDISDLCASFSDSEEGMPIVAAAVLPSPGHVGMEKLLQHVRFPFIKVEQIKTALSKEGHALAKTSPAFLLGVTDALDVQTGRKKAEELGERAQRRVRYKSEDVIPEFDSGWCAKALMAF